MNDNELNNNSSRVNTYRATSNLNTAIENPQINMNSAVGVNIKDVDNSNSYIENGVSHQEFDQTDINNIGTSNQMMDQNMNMGLNSQAYHANSESDFQSSLGSNQFIPNPAENVSGSGVNIHSAGEPKVMYEPTLEEKKKKSNGITVPRELKVMLFIVFILIIFILVMPYIYDFFRNLQLFGG